MGDNKLVTFWHRNQYPQRKFWYLVNKINGEPSKIWHIYTKKSFSKITKIENDVP